MFPQAFYRWRPHPWHGLEVGPEPPRRIHAYIEITPYDLVKYEVDKQTGYMRVDRPQRTSSQPPTLYGFVPRTFCGTRVQQLSPKSTQGDGDPLDICVLSERPINRSEVILNTKVIGGIQMIDNGEADDKIIAVLENDDIWREANDLEDLPEALVHRLRHYFATYKIIHGQPSVVTIEDIYGAEHAMKVVEASMQDYEHEFGG
ncbi:MAG: inorganic pyrophosphatase [Phycisphaerales bacterium JB038]